MTFASLCLHQYDSLINSSVGFFPHVFTMRTGWSHHSFCGIYLPSPYAMFVLPLVIYFKMLF